MPQISSQEWAALHKGKNGKPWSVQYANRRIKELGIPRDREGLIDYATAEALHAGERPPEVAIRPASGPVLVREPGTENIVELSKADIEKRLLYAKTRKAEAERDETEGRLLDAFEARKTFTAVGRMHAQARENVPAQLAPKLVGKTDLNEIEAIVRAALREVDTRTADEINARFPEMAHAGIDSRAS